MHDSRPVPAAGPSATVDNTGPSATVDNTGPDPAWGGKDKLWTTQDRQDHNSISFRLWNQIEIQNR